MKKLLLILCLGILIMSCGKKNNNKFEKQNIQTSKKQKDPKSFAPQIIRNEKTGEYIIQVYVPEMATRDEIYKTLINIQKQKEKEFLSDNIVIAAYSDIDFTNKNLLGTHAQWKIEKGITKYMKILPKTEQLNSEDKKNFLEYLQVVNSFLDYGDNLKKSKQETEIIIKARHPKNYKKIIQKSEKYLFGIENEKNLNN